MNKRVKIYMSLKCLVINVTIKDFYFIISFSILSPYSLFISGRLSQLKIDAKRGKYDDIS